MLSSLFSYIRTPHINTFISFFVDDIVHVVVCVCADLPVPHRVGGVSYDGGASLLAVVGELGESAPLPGLDGHFEVGVGVEEHALLQACCPDVWSGKHTVVSMLCYFFYFFYNHNSTESFPSPDRVKLTSFRQCSVPDWSSTWPSLPT